MGKFLQWEWSEGLGAYLSENVGSDAILLPGMVVSIEPGIYLKDYGGVRIEDIAVVTKDGCKVLEHSERTLIEL